MIYKLTTALSGAIFVLALACATQERTVLQETDPHFAGYVEHLRDHYDVQSDVYASDSLGVVLFEVREAFDRRILECRTTTERCALERIEGYLIRKENEEIKRLGDWYEAKVRADTHERAVAKYWANFMAHHKRVSADVPPQE